MDRYRYIDPEDFGGDAKALFARLVTFGWVTRLRLRARGNPLQESYPGSIRHGFTAIPLLSQLSGRGLLDLVEEYFRGPDLGREAFRLMLPGSLREAAASFREILLGYGTELNADFQQMLQWFEDETVLFQRTGLDLQSPFLCSPQWNLRLRWRECSLEYRSQPIFADGVARVICHQVAGGWSPYGYVSYSRQSLREVENEKGKFRLGDGPGAGEVYLCKNAIDLKAAMLAFKSWGKGSETFTGRHMLTLEDRLGLRPADRYEFYAALFDHLVFHHECGHLHWRPWEDTLRTEVLGEWLYDNHYSLWYSELMAEAYAFEQCVDGTGTTFRQAILALLLPADEALEDFHLMDLIVVRALQEKTPSVYLYDFVHRAVDLLRGVHEELERRAKKEGAVEGELGWYSWFTGQREELLAPFFVWQQEEGQKARERILSGGGAGHCRL